MCVPVVRYVTYADNLYVMRLKENSYNHSNRGDATISNFTRSPSDHILSARISAWICVWDYTQPSHRAEAF